jgi:hypothetical protein
MGWLDSHIKSFILPELGYQPDPIPAFSPNELTVIKNIWRAAKSNAGSRQILLTGRDTWIFEILARRENFPTIFRPEISRAVARYCDRKEFRDCYLFDTGFLGSIPKRLDINHFNLASGKNQIFPKLKSCRSLILKIENLPKYWQTGRVFQGRIVQEKSEKEEFAKAAGITIAVYRNSAPRFINERAPLGTIGKWQELEL